MPNLSAPTVPVFLGSVVLAVLALIGHFAKIPFVTEYQFWIAAYVLLFLGAVLKGF
jgi:putative Mn2+ efflux pump MntP